MPHQPDLIEWAEALGLDSTATWLHEHPAFATILGFTMATAVALISMLLVRRVVLRGAAALATVSKTLWDDMLLQKETLARASWAIPWVVVYIMASRIPNLGEGLVDGVHRVALCGLVFVGLRTAQAFLHTIEAIYGRYPMAKNRPIKGYLQIIMIVAALFGVIVMIALILDRSPWLLLSGLGAMTAVLLLVFRDTLLSLVAGIRLTTNDLIRVGDWIEMPQFGADGDVMEIALHSVKIQNWDRTFSYIPTHAFLEHSFRNWRGMADSGGRRIKRAIHIDLTSIRFLDAAELDGFARFRLLREYIAGKREELQLAAPTDTPSAADEPRANIRRLTNIGTLRAYIVSYMRQHPKVRQDATLMVRQLAPGPEGLPIEIYAFSSEVGWASYEAIQADIFDHVLAIVPEFGLRVFQSPGGADVSGLAGVLAR